MSHKKEPTAIPGAVIEDAKCPQTRTFLIGTAALTAASALVTEYTTPNDSTIRRVFQTDGARQMGLEVFGKGADNAGWQGGLYGLRRYPWGGPQGASAPADRVGKKFADIWRPRPLGVVTAKLGAYTLGLDAGQNRDPLTADGSTVRGTDDWTIANDYTFQQTMRVVHAAGGQFATLMFDPMGCELVVFEGTCLDPDTVANATGIMPFIFRC